MVNLLIDYLLYYVDNFVIDEDVKGVVESTLQSIPTANYITNTARLLKAPWLIVRKYMSVGIYLHVFHFALSLCCT